MNKSRELNKLFKAYMARKEDESKNQSKRHCNFLPITIFFYEWSDITRKPLRYFSLSLFEKFLSDSGIVFEDWQRDMIPCLGDVYITCKPNSKDLLIRCSYEALKAALNLPSDSQLYIPPSNSQTNTPNQLRLLSPMYNEHYY